MQNYLKIVCKYMSLGKQFVKIGSLFFDFVFKLEKLLKRKGLF